MNIKGTVKGVHSEHFMFKRWIAGECRKVISDYEGFRMKFATVDAILTAAPNPALVIIFSSEQEIMTHHEHMKVESQKPPQKIQAPPTSTFCRYLRGIRWCWIEWKGPCAARLCRRTCCNAWRLGSKTVTSMQTKFEPPNQRCGGEWEDEKYWEQWRRSKMQVKTTPILSWRDET